MSKRWGRPASLTLVIVAGTAAVLTVGGSAGAKGVAQAAPEPRIAVRAAFVRPGQWVHRGQLPARADIASLRRRLRSAESNLAGAKARVAKARQLAIARYRQMQVWSALARTVGNYKVALDDARTAAEAAKTGFEQRMAGAGQSLTNVRGSAQASQAELQATVDRAQRSFDHARRVSAADAANLGKEVARARRNLARAQIGAQAPNASLQAAVDRAQQSVDAAKASQAQNAQAYQAAVDQAQNALAAAQSALSNDQEKLSSAQSDRDRYQGQVDSLQKKVDNQQAKVNSDKAALASCNANPPAAGCTSLQKAYDDDKATLNDLKSSLSAAESNLAGAKSSVSSLESTLAGDQSLVVSAQSSLTNAQQAQSSGLAHDAQAVQAAQDALASAQAAAASGGLESRKSLAGAQQSLDSAIRKSGSRLAIDRQSFRDAEARLAKARKTLASGVGRKVQAVRRALESVKQRWRSSVARDDQSIRAAADSLRSAQQALSTSLASNTAFAQAPTAGDLAVAEIQVELTRLSVAVARMNLVEGRVIRAPAAGTVAAVIALLPEQRLRTRLAAAQEAAFRERTGVVGIARRYLGVPYVWGGASPSAGFDCSGLVLYVYAKVGVSLPHYAAAQYNYGVPVSRDQLEPGDLVFFDGLGHVGIYIGNDEFIQAPRTGDVVKISSLAEPAYATAYAGARRLENEQRSPASSRAGTAAGRVELWQDLNGRPLLRLSRLQSSVR